MRRTFRHYKEEVIENGKSYIMKYQSDQLTVTQVDDEYGTQWEGKKFIKKISKGT
jgi:hypothetical protein